jgi:acid phosphatase
MPYLCGLAAANGLALHFYANSHGSLRDYLYVTSGSTWTASPQDCTGSACAKLGVITGDNLVRALTSAGKSWRGYFEGMPSQGYMGGDTDGYYLHHNPFPWYSDVAGSAAQQKNMYPFTQLGQDEQANSYADFSFIVPNDHDDADDPATGTAPSVLLATADSWLESNMGPLLATAPFQAGGDGILIVVFDEGDVSGESGDKTSDDSCSPTQSTGCGGHVALVMIGPQVNPGSTASATYHFQDLLHTIIHLLGLSDYMNGASGGGDIGLLPGVQ